MGSSTTLHSSNTQIKKYKAACDHPAARIGKPPGSRNKKTLERTRRYMVNIDGNKDSHSSTTLLQGCTKNGRPACALDQASNETSALDKDNTNQNSDSIPDFGPLSPSIDGFLDSLHSPPVIVSDLLKRAIGDGPVVAQSVNLDMPDLGKLGGANEDPSWDSVLADSWNSLSSAGEQRLFPATSDTDAPLSTQLYPSCLDRHSPITLDTVAARLEPSRDPTEVPFGQSLESSSMLCNCLRKYTDVLCQLQTIEKRQHPVQTDTLLTSANLVLSMTERQTRCRHELTKEERSHVKAALVIRALKRANAMLRFIMSRTSNTPPSQQGEDSWTQSEIELPNVQRLADSLFLIAKLILGHHCLSEGAGVHMWNLQLKHFIKMQYYFYVSRILYIPAIFFVKLAILSQYLRLLAPNMSVNRTLFIAARVIIVASLVFYIISTFLTIFACSPLEKIWNPLIQGGRCLNNNNIGVLISILFNIISDVVILLLPVKTVWGLQIPRNKKIKILALFATGLLACIASSMIVFYIVRMSQKYADVSYNCAWLGFWAWAEISLGIVVTCTFSLPKLVEAKGKNMRIALSNLAKPLTSFTSFKTLVRSARIDQATMEQYHSSSDLTNNAGEYSSNTQRPPPKKRQARTEIRHSTSPTDMSFGVAGPDTSWFRHEPDV
ncbi:MAG: hypothetical protein Q9213_004656 [Squamulea squamosa]